MSESKAKLTAEVARLRDLVRNNDMMAECMHMVREDLIAAGIIDKSVPPMMVSDAVCAHIQGIEKAAP